MLPEVRSQHPVGFITDILRPEREAWADLVAASFLSLLYISDGAGINIYVFDFGSNLCARKMA